MYLKFVFANGKIPKEFGKSIQNCVYFSNDKKIITKNKKEQIEFFGKFSTINLFVGANSSGKSRFLRGLLRSDEYLMEIYRRDYTINSIVKEIDKWYEDRFNSFGSLSWILANEIQPIVLSFRMKNEFYHNILKNINSYKPHFETAKKLYDKDKIEVNKINLDPRRNEALRERIGILKVILNLRDEIDFSIKKQPDSKIYIPILRSIKTSSKINNTIFEDTTKELYEISGSHIFTGLDLFDKILKIRNSRKDKRKGFEEFEYFLSRYFFDQKQVEIISEINEKHIVIYVDGEENKIHDIGDGIQAIILLMFPIYTANNNTWVFIEEPETYLHPGLQKVFLETLANDEFLKTKNLTYFFTTHSNHFLDRSLDSNEVSIFQFEKEKENKFNIKTNVNPSKSVLDILGVNTSSVFLANTSLWVEGPTDRKYLSKFLKLYCKHNNKQFLKEDIDFAFFEYGGNLIAHYLFDNENFEGDDSDIRNKINSFALSNKIYLLADEDDAKENTKKGQRRIALEELSNSTDNFKYQNTELREIENLLPRKTIKAFLEQIVDKQEVTNIDFEKSDYDKLGLGSFYEQQFEKHGILKKNRKAFLAESGTLRNDYKIKLCNFFINSDIKYEDIIDDNPILEKIIKNLYAFIKN